MDDTDTPVPGQQWPPRLSTRTVLTAAITVVDRGGAAQLTMRGLGPVLGVQAMSLYRYFPSREALLEDVAATVTEELDRAVARREELGGDWQDYVATVADETRQLAWTHPWLFVLVATQPTPAPGLRPPIRSPHWAEQFLHTLEKCGFRPAAAQHAYTQVTTFLLGRLLPDATALTVSHQHDPAAPSRPAAAPIPVAPPVDANQWPRVRTLTPSPISSAAVAFDRDLAVLLKELDRERDS